MENNRTFPLKFGENEYQLVNVAYEDKSWLWHLNYGHLNFNILNILTSNALVLGLPKDDEYKKTCKRCAKGKHARESFPKGNAGRAHHGPLELIHSDMCGPM